MAVVLDEFNFETIVIAQDLLIAGEECTQRGLNFTAKWLAEMDFAVTQKLDPDVADSLEYQQPKRKGRARYILAKKYFDVKEYSRCAHYTQGCKDQVGMFLHYYSRYMAGEKVIVEDESDKSSEMKIAHLKLLHQDLGRLRNTAQWDGYLCYLHGLVLRKMDLPHALQVLQDAVNLTPLNWAAWLELANLIKNSEMLSQLKLPDCWMKYLFMGHILGELHLDEAALSLYEKLHQGVFEHSLYVKSQIAKIYYSLRDGIQAATKFSEIREEDPFCLDAMDVYSNVLYVQINQPELAQLAHQAFAVDKYRVETCCIVGNYYGLRGQHEKAVLYLQRALKLNPHYSYAWTIMGHENIEMKNSNAAIACYRKATEMNMRDFRAWYGLGQAYEIIKMPLYSLYYYRMAQSLKPDDSRMLVALGDAYDKLDRLHDAKKCYWKAHCVGDLECIALLRLAKTYDKLKETDHAAAAYCDYLRDSEKQGSGEGDEHHGQAYLYLASYYLSKGPQFLDLAREYAQKCVEYPTTLADGKALLREVAQRCQEENSRDQNSIFHSRQPLRRVGGEDSLNLVFTP
uniref:EOG090X03CE n=1 Tax=Daphnia hispanica TaxID=575233 RepID=A0A4Y7M559_9CRUS|nr:EOG090X03CE [Daphnia hispanica]